MPKHYNIPHCTCTTKTHVTEEGHADFMERLTAYGISQSEFIRQAITSATVKPVITVSSVNDELLTAVGKLTGEYEKSTVTSINQKFGPRCLTLPPSSSKCFGKQVQSLATLKHIAFKNADRRNRAVPCPRA